MSAWFQNNTLSMINYLDFILRLAVSMVCGGLIGLERERRMKNAGLRTHIIVALSASLMMIVSKYAFMDIVTLEGMRLQVDGSRIASAVVQAIGFIGAGVIYIRRENAVGLTTAAGLWATVGIGLAIGAGLYEIGVIATFFILGTQYILHAFHSKSHSQNVGNIKCNITKHNITVKQYKEWLENEGLQIRDVSMTKNENGEVILSANVVFKPEEMMSLAEKLSVNNNIDKVEIYPVF